MYSQKLLNKQKNGMSVEIYNLLLSYCDCKSNPVSKVPKLNIFLILIYNNIIYINIFLPSYKIIKGPHVLVKTHFTL